jgi:hypothetical protein
MPSTHPTVDHLLEGMRLKLAHEQSFLDYARRPARHYRVRLVP